MPPVMYLKSLKVVSRILDYYGYFEGLFQDYYDFYDSVDYYGGFDSENSFYGIDYDSIYYDDFIDDISLGYGGQLNNSFYGGVTKDYISEDIYNSYSYENIYNSYINSSFYSSYLNDNIYKSFNYGDLNSFFYNGDRYNSSMYNSFDSVNIYEDISYLDFTGKNSSDNNIYNSGDKVVNNIKNIKSYVFDSNYNENSYSSKAYNSIYESENKYYLDTYDFDKNYYQNSMTNEFKDIYNDINTFMNVFEDYSYSGDSYDRYTENTSYIDLKNMYSSSSKILNRNIDTRIEKYFQNNNYESYEYENIYNTVEGNKNIYKKENHTDKINYNDIFDVLEEQLYRELNCSINTY